MRSQRRRFRDIISLLFESLGAGAVARCRGHGEADRTQICSVTLSIVTVILIIMRLSFMQIPSASSLPSWVQKVQYILNPLAYFAQASRQSLDIVNAPIFGKHHTTLLISNPQALQQLFTHDTKQFDTPANNLLRPLVGDYSLFCLEGSRHIRERKLLLPSFHGERIHNYGQLIVQLTEQVMSQLTPGQIFTARNLMQTISLEVILQAVFGLHQGVRFEQLQQLIVELADTFQSPLVSVALFFPQLQYSWGGLSPWHKFIKLKQKIDDLMVAEIRDRRQQNYSDRADILSLLLTATDEAGQPMSDLELRDQLMTLLFAGHETTATAIAWALYWIHRQPEVKTKLCQELANLQANADPMTIFKLPYLSAVCSETLRINPVAILTVPREVKEAVTLLGYNLQPGTRIYGSIYALHHREDLYPQPQQFRPERFLERNFTPYEYIPFGGGIRRCLGEALAMWEMKLVIATIMSKYQLALANNQPEIPKRRGVTVAPGRGVEMILQSINQ